MSKIEGCQLKDPEVVYEYDNGWKMLYVNTKDDLTRFGNAMHHCAGSQWVWAIEEKIYYFFTLCDPKGGIHGTIHMKQASWMNKKHPRDGERGTGLIPRCSAYDSGARRHYGEVTLTNRYGGNLPNLGKRPKGVDAEVWNELTKAWKAAEDNYAKNVGAIHVTGRRVKFDGKYLIVLSANGSYQSDGDDQMKMFGEFVNSLNKSKRKEKIAA